MLISSRWNVKLHNSFGREFGIFLWGRTHIYSKIQKIYCKCVLTILIRLGVIFCSKIWSSNPVPEQSTHRHGTQALEHVRHVFRVELQHKPQLRDVYGSFISQV